jgi:Flp pilus assembly CpaE family ATPase
MSGAGQLPLEALLIAPNRELAGRLAAALAQAEAFRILEAWPVYPDERLLETRLAQVGPEVVLLDVSTDFGRAAELIGRLKTARPPVPVVAVDARSGGETVVGSLRAGACEFLDEPFDPGVQEQAAARIRRLIAPRGPREPGRVLAFVGAKPGTGVSTLAAGTACALARQTKRKVLLADMEFLGGAPNTRAPGALVDLARVSAAEDLVRTVERARGRYGWLVLDLPPVFYRASAASVGLAEKVYLVTTAELASLHLAQRAIAVLAQAGYDRGRLEMLVNRTRRRCGKTPLDVATILGPPVRHRFPEDRGAVEQRQGEAVAASSELGRAVAEFASELLKAPPARKAQ